jgi:ornithine cyclodeaminase
MQKMSVITNSEVASVLTAQDSIAVMRDAFIQYSQAGTMQERVRIDCADVKLSMMGAILPGREVVGAKIYTTINGKFCFVVALFSTRDGSLLAVMEADAMTEYRTAAVTAVAADALASPQAEVLSIFGTGIQARSHAAAMLSVRRFSEVLVCGIEGTTIFASDIATRFGVPCRVVLSKEAASNGDVIVTATRSANPLFDGRDVKPNAFVAAIGSSKPDAREIDDELVKRASTIVVEWKKQAMQEAGDLLLCEAGTLDWNQVAELGDILQRDRNDNQQRQCGIVLYKAIGVGLEDVALAEHICRRLGIIGA